MRYLTLCFVLSLSCMPFFKTHAQPFGNFIKFDGVNDTLFRKGGDLFMPNTNYTIEFWFRICEDTFPRRQTIFSFNRNLNLYMHGQYIGGDSIAYLLCSDDVSNNNIITCHTNLRQGRDLDWHHIAITYERFSRNFELYYDGYWADLQGSNKHILSAWAGTFYIGYSSYYSHINIFCKLPILSSD
jgi:hypothetical protein